jgi:GH25 family lysozyme M1 (1,4-beta-N-acetylmuramidase)
MKFSLSLALLSITSVALGKLLGQDVSHYQGVVDWKAQKEAGSNFVFIKATESTTYIDSSFNANYDGAADAGIIRGAYHFARPAASSGKTQANYFLKHGGGWSNDGKTLPGALDLEFNPDGDTCYGLSTNNMVAWIKDFSDTYHAETKRYPVIYTTKSWWDQCTGSSTAFGKTHPLWLARYADSPGATPAGWSVYFFWQFNDKGTLVGDNNYWNGDIDGLKKFARLAE